MTVSLEYWLLDQNKRFIKLTSLYSTPDSTSTNLTYGDKWCLGFAFMHPCDLDSESRLRLVSKSRLRLVSNCRVQQWLSLYQVWKSIHKCVHSCYMPMLMLLTQSVKLHYFPWVKKSHTKVIIIRMLTLNCFSTSSNFILISWEVSIKMKPTGFAFCRPCDSQWK